MTRLKRTLVDIDFRYVILNALFDTFNVSRYLKNVEIFEHMVAAIDNDGFITRNTFDFMTPKVYRLHISTSVDFEKISHGHYIVASSGELCELVIAFKEFNLLYSDCWGRAVGSPRDTGHYQEFP